MRPIITTLTDYFKLYGWSLAMVCGALILNIVFVFGVRSSHRDFVQRNEELSLLSAKKAGLLQISRDESKIQPIYERINGSFVSADNLVEFIEYLEDTARENGGSAEVEGVLQEENGNRKFKLSLAASYANLVNFLAYLENSRYLVKPLRIDINETINPETKNALLRAVIDLEVASL